MKILLARYPDQKFLIAMADAITRGLIKFWQPWHMEKTHEYVKLTKPIKWDIIPNGDYEWPHALVRFGHMLDLAIAFRLTGNDKYICSYIEHIKDFSVARFNKRLDLWDSSLDAAIRLQNLIRSFDLIRAWPKLPDETILLFYTLTLTESKLLYENLGRRVANWEFFITTSLLVSTTYLSEKFDTAVWRNAAHTRLKEILQTEITADGNLIEQVPMYHGECLLDLLDYLVILEANDLKADAAIVDKVVAMADCLAVITDPRGFIMPIGDSDVFDAEYILNYANLVLEYLGNKRRIGLCKPSSSSQDPIGLVKNVLSPTGWVTLRWKDGDERDWLLFLDASGKPPDRRAGHSHADDLQFLLHNSDGPIFIDPGRYTYARYFGKLLKILNRPIDQYGRLAFIYRMFNWKFRSLNTRNWSKYFRSTLSHNTISCDDLERPDYDSQTYRRRQVQLEQSITLSPLVWLKTTNLPSTADMENSVDKKSGYKHSRILAAHLPNIVVIYDIIESDQDHQWISSFHLGAGCEAKIEANRIIIKTAGGTDVHMTWAELLGNGAQVSIDNEWVSPEYNRKYPAYAPRITTNPCSKMVLVTALDLKPRKEVDTQSNIEFKMIGDTSSGQQVCMVRCISGRDTLDLYVNPRGEIFSHDKLKSDALLSVIKQTEGHPPFISSLAGDVFHYDNKKFKGKNEP